MLENKPGPEEGRRVGHLHQRQHLHRGRGVGPGLVKVRVRVRVRAGMEFATAPPLPSPHPSPSMYHPPQAPSRGAGGGVRLDPVRRASVRGHGPLPPAQHPGGGPGRGRSPARLPRRPHPRARGGKRGQSGDGRKKKKIWLCQDRTVDSTQPILVSLGAHTVSVATLVVVSDDQVSEY